MPKKRTGPRYLPPQPRQGAGAMRVKLRYADEWQISGPISNCRPWRYVSRRKRVGSVACSMCAAEGFAQFLLAASSSGPPASGLALSGRGCLFQVPVSVGVSPSSGSSVKRSLRLGPYIRGGFSFRTDGAPRKRRRVTLPYGRIDYETRVCQVARL